MKPISGKRMCKILEAHGWAYSHTKGSHAVYKRDGSPFAIAVPVHANKDLRIGTAKNIMRQAGLTDDDL